MKHFKKFEYGMWHLYAYESDGSQDAIIPIDLIPVSQAEVAEIKALPISDEYRERLEDGVKALGGRNAARYPPKEYKDAIGHMCVNAAHLEVSLGVTIWHVAGVTSDIGMAMTGGMRITALLETLQAIVKAKKPELNLQAERICSNIARLYKERGKYVHAIWTVGKGGQPVISKTFRGKSSAKSDEIPVSLDTMYDIAEGFLRLEGELGLYLFKPLTEK